MKEKVLMKKSSFFCLLIMMLTFGCSRIYVIKIDSINNSKVYPYKKYLIIPGNKGLDTSDLIFNEFSTYLDRVLLSKGYNKAENIDGAEIAIIMSYGISEPEISYHSEPIHDFRGGTSTFEIDSYGSEGYSHSSGNVSTTPEMQVVGSEVVKDVVFNRYLILIGVDLKEFKKDNKIKPMWETTITSKGESDDLRKVFPILVAAADDYLGLNTNGKVTVRLTEYHDKVKKVRGLVKSEVEPNPESDHKVQPKEKF